MIDRKIYEKIIELIQTTEKDNPDLINYITSHKESLYGPAMVTEEQIQRTLGPEPGMLNHESKEDFQNKVVAISNKLKNLIAEEIYIICEKHGDTYYILDGNHTFEALRLNDNKHFSVIYSTDSVIYKQLNP